MAGGKTAESLSGQHSRTTDIALTTRPPPAGRTKAAGTRQRWSALFSAALCGRQDKCGLAGPRQQGHIRQRLVG